MTKATDPAYPVRTSRQVGVDRIQIPDPNSTAPLIVDRPMMLVSDHLGMDIRTRIAMAAMQGMLANEWCSASDKQVVEQAVFMADALIEQLNREEGK